MPIDPARQQQAKEYARLRHRLLALELALTTLALVAVIALGLNVWLKQSVFAITRDPSPGSGQVVWLATFLYFAVAFVTYAVMFFPLSYYSGFVLPHRYGLSTQTRRAWLADELKGGALGSVLGGVVIGVIYFVLRAAPPLPLLAGGAGGGASWWLWASAFMLVFNVLPANLAPVPILPIFFKFKPLEDAELVARLTALAARAVSSVWRFNFQSATVEMKDERKPGDSMSVRFCLSSSLFHLSSIRQARSLQFPRAHLWAAAQPAPSNARADSPGRIPCTPRSSSQTRSYRAKRRSS